LKTTRLIVTVRLRIFEAGEFLKISLGSTGIVVFPAFSFLLLKHEYQDGDERSAYSKH